MDLFNSYGLIILASVIVILSYLYNIISKATNIPSVLLLITTGILIKEVLSFFEVPSINFFPILEILGIVGVIMIVLEAALDLELQKEKTPIILKSFFVGLLGLATSVALAAVIIYLLTDSSFQQAILYGIPLSILSSAIIIPSISNLAEEKKEFLIYESTLSDILGIMVFYFYLDGLKSPDANHALSISLNIGATVIVSLLFSYVLVVVFQKIKTHIKLFLLIAVLLMLYSVGKLLHISSLLIILVFGLILNNHKLFFGGFMQRFIHKARTNAILSDFKIITAETAFVVRTFFFVIFGITISLASLFSFHVVVISGLILISIYASRALLLKLFIGGDISPTVYVAPRGLITILLFYAIPMQHQIPDFDTGILLFVILITSIIMTVALVRNAANSNNSGVPKNSNELPPPEATDVYIES